MGFELAICIHGSHIELIKVSFMMIDAFYSPRYRVAYGRGHCWFPALINMYRRKDVIQ